MKEKYEELLVLVGRTTPTVAASIMHALDTLKESGKLDLAAIEKLMDLARQKIAELKDLAEKPKRLLKLDRMYFEPFSDLFESGEIDKLLPGSFPRGLLAKIWTAIETKIFDSAARELAAEAADALADGSTFQANIIAAKLRDMTISLIENSANLSLIARFDDTISKQAAERFYGLLKIEQLSRAAGIKFDTDIDAISDMAGSKHIKFLADLEAKDINWAADYIVMIMVHSKRPWHVVKLLSVISRGTNDRKLSITAFNVVGERIFAILERKLSEIEATSNQIQFDGKALALKIEEYSKMNQGLERESIMTHDGPWRTHITAIRKAAGKIYVDICNHAETAVSKGFVLNRTMVKGAGMLDLPSTNRELDVNKVVTALAFCAFIREVRLFAPLAGFGGARDAAQKSIINHLDTLKNGMMMLKKNEETGRYFDDWISATAELIKEIDNNEVAKSFERRIRA